MMMKSPCMFVLCWFFVKLSIVRISNGSHLQLSGTRLSVSQSTVILQPFSPHSSLSSRMFLLTDALLISQNFSLVSGHITEETFNAGKLQHSAHLLFRLFLFSMFPQITAITGQNIFWHKKELYQSDF